MSIKRLHVDRRKMSGLRMHHLWQWVHGDELGPVALLLIYVYRVV